MPASQHWGADDNETDDTPSPAKSSISDDSSGYGIDVEAAETSCVSYNRLVEEKKGSDNNHNDDELYKDDEDETDSSSSSCCCASCCSGVNRHCSLIRQHLSCFYFPNIGVAVGTAIFGTLIPVSLRHLGESDAMIGLVVSLSGVGRLLAEIPVSMISQKFGPMRIMIAAMIVVVACFILPIIRNDTAMFVVSNAVGGVAIAGFATPRHELIREVFTKGNRNIVSGHMGAIGRISFLIGPSLGGVCYSHFGYRVGYASAVVWLFACLVSLIVSAELRQVDEKLRLEQAEHDLKHRQEEEEEAQQKLTKDNKKAPHKDSMNGNDREVPLLVADEMATEKGDGDDNDDDDRRNGARGSVLSQMEFEEDPADAERKWLQRHEEYDRRQRRNNNNDDDDFDDDAKNLMLVGSPSQARLPWGLSLYDDEGEAQTPASSETNGGTVNDNDDDDDGGQEKAGEAARAAEAEHRKEKAGVLQAICTHWRTVVSVGLLVLSIMAIRQARRLTIQLRALNLGMNARDVGFVLAGSFVIDTIFFWVSALVVNSFGYRYAIVSLTFFYSCAFVVLSFDKTTSYWSLFAALPVFGVGDSFGAGIVLALISDLCPRPVIGATRVFLDAGVMVGPLVTGVLSHTMHLQRCCWVLAAWCLVTLVVGGFLLKDGIGKEKEKEKEKEEAPSSK